MTLDLWTVFIAAIILMIKPGPYIIALSSLAIDGRWKAIIIFWLGTEIASLISYFALLKGLSLIPEDFGFIYIFLKSAAAIAFTVMGLNTLKRAYENEVIQQNTVQRNKERITSQTFWESIIAGFFNSFSNPFVILFILTAIPALTGKLDFSLIEISYIKLVVIAADILVLLIYCVPLFLLRRALSPSILNNVKYLSGFLLLGVALYLFINMLSQWDLHASGLFS